MSRTQETAAVSSSPRQETKYLSRLVVRRYLPDLSPDSPLLPPDRWVLTTARDLYKTVAPLRRDVRMAGFAGGAYLVAAGYGVAALVLAVTGGFAAAAGALLAGVIIGGVSTLWGRQLLERFRAETLPLLRVGVTQHYLLFKMDSLGERVKKKSKPVSGAEAATPVPAVSGTVALADRIRDFDRKKISGLFAKGAKAVKSALPKKPEKKAPPEDTNPPQP